MHPSIALYWLLKGTKWTHLPVAGGWYDQHPTFVDHMYMLLSIENQVDAKNAKERERKQKLSQAKSGRGKGRR